jgi:hypothetical protein
LLYLVGGETAPDLLHLLIRVFWVRGTLIFAVRRDCHVLATNCMVYVKEFNEHPPASSNGRGTAIILYKVTAAFWSPGETPNEIMIEV